MKVFKALIKPLIIIIALGVGVFTFWHLLGSKKRPRPAPAAPMQVSATVITPQKASYEPHIEVMGEVKAKLAVKVIPEVGGKITYLSPKLFVGGHFKEDELILSLDKRDYQINLRQQEAAVAQAKVALEEQKALAAAASNELKLLDKRGVGVSDSGKRLASRKAYVESAKAQLDSAMSKLELAKLQLKRTEVRAPFAAVVKSIYVDKGQVVSGGSTLLELVGDEEVYVVASIMLNQLKYISIPQNGEPSGSIVEVNSQTTGLNNTMRGRVKSTYPDLKEKSQLAQLLITVPQKGADKLLIGTVVNCTIIGNKVEDIVRIPRLSLRENNIIWVVDAAGKLAERPVNPLFNDKDYYYLNAEGLDLSERIITSRLALPVPGMPVNIVEGK